MKRTANVDLQFAKVSHIVNRKVHDEVSVRRQVAGTLQVRSRDDRQVLQVISIGVAGTLQGDCGADSNGARILATDSVVPQRGWRDGRRNIGQTDDEIVRSCS